MIEFDEAKRKANLAKHGCDFLAAKEFDWQTAIIYEDVRFAYGEVRQIAIGFIGVALYQLVFTERGENIRVISLRIASRKERLFHEKAHK